MIKRFTLLLAACAAVFAAQAGYPFKLCDVDYTLDTLYHAKIGPGTTQTSLRLLGETPATQLRIYYLTIDRTNPNISFQAVVANDKLSGGATIADQAKSHSTADKTLFCGINTDFFVTTGNAVNGVSRVGAPVQTAIADGKIYLTNSSSRAWPNFYFENGEPFIAAVSHARGEVKAGEKTASLSVVNSGVWNNSCALYTPEYYGTTDNASLAGSVAERTLELVEGTVGMGKTAKYKVTSDVSTNGDLRFSDGAYAISGRGTGVDFVNGLAIGDIIEITPRAFVGDKEIFPTDMCTGNPWILENGIVLDSEVDRGDASGLHPRSGIGFNADKSKIIMMVIDGRYALSNGVHTKQLAEMMYYAGATDATNVDGGGSSTLYTSAFGERNHCSDGRPRAVSSGMFAVANTPADDVITEIRFVEWAMEFPQYGIYTPKFYGYNQYGMLVDDDVQGVTLTCDANIGEIINDGTTFYGSGSGIGVLKGTLNGLEATIPVTVDTSEEAKLRLENVLIDDVREYPIEMLSYVRENEMPISPIAFTWTSDNTDVATVGETTGLLKGLKDGTAVVTASLGEFAGKLNVTVEVPTGNTMPVVRDLPIENWTLKQTGGTGLALSLLGDNGFKLNYTGNGSSRGAFIQMDREMRVWSLPDKIRLTVNPGEATINKVTASASDALGKATSTWTATETTLPKNTETTVEFDLNDFTTPDDIAVFPITINSLRFGMGASAKNTEFEIQIPKFEAVYNNAQGAVNAITAPRAIIYPNPVAAGQTVYVIAGEKAKVEVFALNGALVSSQNCNGNCQIATTGLNGMYIIKVTGENGVKTAKLIVR
ncbi:MAG: phosphodiester glycosidase family protein [Bacteroidales bacterium]|nr:phosphodiester glycosidase family protein [Bacteroidales bacterium]MDD6141555.1 phosphodiester glycosidase family protein [Bacteroidales bacterium]